MDVLLRPPMVEQIKRAVCMEFGISKEQIEGERRREFILPRDIAMALARRLTNLSYPNIGRRFGGRDHGGALGAWRRLGPYVEHAAALLPADAPIAQWVHTVRALRAMGSGG